MVHNRPDRPPVNSENCAPACLSHKSHNRWVLARSHIVMVHALSELLYSLALDRSIWRLLPAVVRLMPAPGLHTCREAGAHPPYHSDVECICNALGAHSGRHSHCARLRFVKIVLLPN